MGVNLSFGGALISSNALRRLIGLHGLVRVLPLLQRCGGPVLVCNRCRDDG